MEKTKKQKKINFMRILKRNWVCYLFILPMLIYVIIFNTCLVLSLLFCRTVELCHNNKFLVCENLPGNKAHSDSDSDSDQ